MIDFKKLLPFLIIAVVIAVAGAGLYWQKQWQKTHIPLDISSEAVQAKCLEDVSKMTDEQLIEKINTLPFATGEELIEINKNMLNYLICRLPHEIAEFQGINIPLNDATKALVQLMNIPDSAKLDVFQRSIIGEIAGDNESPYWGQIDINSALKPIEVFCPNDKISPDFLEFCLNEGRLSPEKIHLLTSEQIERARSHCYKHCDYLVRYEKNRDNFEADMKTFSWFENFELQKSQALIRASMAYRAGGRELGLNLCDSIPNPLPEIKDDCRQFIESVDYINCKDFGFDQTRICERKKYEECEKFFQEAKDLICQPRGQ